MKKKIDRLVIFIRNSGWKDLILTKLKELDPQMGTNYHDFS